MVQILGLILKFLPYLVPILKGFFGALGNLKSAEGKDREVSLDLEELEAFVEEQTSRVIKEVIEKNKDRLIAYVPNEEQAARDRRLDELMEELEEAQARYESQRKRSPQSEMSLE